jgi:uncharacterized protein (DUF2384 family)
MERSMTQLASHSTTQNKAHDPSSVAAKAVLNIAQLWRLSDRDLSIVLGGVSVPSIQRWRRQVRDEGRIRGVLSRDQLDRISYMLGIYKALHILLPNDNQADTWIHRPVDLPGFDGRAAIELMREGGMQNLQYIRRFLDGWRG